MLSGKWWLFCLGLHVLSHDKHLEMHGCIIQHSYYSCPDAAAHLVISIHTADKIFTALGQFHNCINS